MSLALAGGLLALAVACGDVPTPVEEPGPDEPDPPPSDTTPPDTASADTTPGTIRLNPLVRYQTINGWFATAQVGEYACPSFNIYRDELFDRTVNELGLNRIKIPVRAGFEHPVDHYAAFVSGQKALQEWQSTWFTAVNDNNDPYSVNPNGFHWGALDANVNNIVLPMRQRLQARGERLIFLLTFTDNRQDTFDHKRFPQEYAEYLLALFTHMQSNYGFVPDIVEVVNEPDVSKVAWTGLQLGNAIVAAGSRLEAAGFTPKFAVPGTASMAKANTRFDEAVAVSGALRYIGEISYHRYHDVSNAALQGIGNRARGANIGSSMSEHIGSGHEDLHEDLKVGMATAWMQFALALCGPGTRDGGGIYYRIDETNPSNPVITARKRTPFLWQYFRYVREGAERYDATSVDNKLDPLGFVNTNGKHAIVVKASGAADFTVGILPPGRYGITYATDNASDVALDDVVLQQRGKVPASIPAAGVITIFAK